MTNRKSHMHFDLIGTKIAWEATTAKRMKIDPYTISGKNVGQRL